MATQLADVESICKVHKLVHTKIRNRLANATVYTLMYCYINLRYDNESHLEDFLVDALYADDDDVGDETEITGFVANIWSGKPRWIYLFLEKLRLHLVKEQAVDQ